MSRDDALALCDAVERIPLALADGRLVALADAIRDALQRARVVREEFQGFEPEYTASTPREAAHPVRSAGEDATSGGRSPRAKSAPAEKLELYPPELASAGADVVPGGA